MSPHIIGPGLFLVTQGTYGDIMVKELVCRHRVLGSAIYVHDLTGLNIKHVWLTEDSYFYSDGKAHLNQAYCSVASKDLLAFYCTIKHNLSDGTSASIKKKSHNIF